MPKILFLLVVLLFFVPTPDVPAVILLERDNTDDPNPPHALYLVDMLGNREVLLAAEENKRFERYENGILWLNTGETLLTPGEVTPVVTPDHERILAGISPLYGPAVVTAPGLEQAENRLYSMSGQSNPYVNLYAVIDGNLQQLTDVISLFPNSQAPFLSASAEFLSVRPDHPSFLFRARLRDAAGNDFNGLYLYDFQTGETHTMPFFGKNPVWSPDGVFLAGSRLTQRNSQPPIYELWVSHVETGAENFIANGCNPQYSPDGAWLAYDLHESSQWQGYTDCFANGQVAAIRLDTGETLLLSKGLEKFVTLVGWIQP